MKTLCSIIFSIALLTGCQKSSLYEYPKTKLTDADISGISFSVSGVNVTRSVSINKELSKIEAVVQETADITKLVPRANVADGAIVSPAMGIANNFSAPVIYSVQSGDGSINKSWTITITQ